MATVPYSQLKPYAYYIAPAPSDEARFLTSNGGSPDYLKSQRALLVNFVGRRLHLMDKFENGSWEGHLMQDDGNVKSVSFDETAFPPGQLFQEIPWNWKPAAPLPPLPPDPWDEFVHSNEMDFKTNAEREAYEKKNPSLKIGDVLTQPDIVAQKRFVLSLVGRELGTLIEYKRTAYRFTNPLMLGDKEVGPKATQYYAKELTAGLPKERPGPGYIPEFMGNFTKALFKAPKLTQEINVFRGIVSEEGLNIPGTLPLSTSYDKYQALEFAQGLRGCCMLKINVKPGVRIIALDLVLMQHEDAGEKEILICPPYNAKIEDVEQSNGQIKQVTITPAARYRGGTRRRRRLRQTKKLTSKF